MNTVAESTTHRTLHGQTVAWTPTVNGLPATLAPGTTTPAALPPVAPSLPEAPVSMNLLVEVPGYANRCQVTGRGTSGVEAARNLKDGVDALTAAFAPVAPLPSRTARLAALLACGTAKALAAGDDARIDRLARAYVIVMRGMVEEITMDGVGQGRYEVRSQSAPDSGRYEVCGQRCACQDARRHAEDKGWYCKHSIAALYVTRLNEQEGAQAC